VIPKALKILTQQILKLKTSAFTNASTASKRHLLDDVLGIPFGVKCKASVSDNRGLIQIIQQKLNFF
jgi:hypothetical protein